MKGRSKSKVFTSEHLSNCIRFGRNGGVKCSILQYGYYSHGLLNCATVESLYVLMTNCPGVPGALVGCVNFSAKTGQIQSRCPPHCECTFVGDIKEGRA